MALMSLRSSSHVKASMVLTRADHLFIHNYIRSLLNKIMIHFIKLSKIYPVNFSRMENNDTNMIHIYMITNIRQFDNLLQN